MNQSAPGPPGGGRLFRRPCKLEPVVDLSNVPEIPQRPPNLAPDALTGHFYAVKRSRAGPPTIYPTDIGCYTLGFCRRCNGDFLICMDHPPAHPPDSPKSQIKKWFPLLETPRFPFRHSRSGECGFQTTTISLSYPDNASRQTGHQANPAWIWD